MLSVGIEIRAREVCGVVMDVQRARVRVTMTRALPEEGDGWEEPTQWLHATGEMMRELAAWAGDEWRQLRSVGVTATDGGMVLLDSEDRVVRMRPCVDELAEEREELAREFGGGPGFIEMLGTPLPPDSMAPKLRWLRRRDPDAYGRIAKVLTAQDFLGYWLTGVPGCSLSSAATSGLFSVTGNSWCRDLVEFIDPCLWSRLPSGLVSMRPRGALRGGLLKAWELVTGVVVAPGLGHVAARLLACGVTRPGDLAAEQGASAGLTWVSERSLVDFLGEGRAGRDAAGHAYLRWGLRNAAALPEAICGHYGWDQKTYGEAVARTPPGAGGLMFLPYLGGAEAPCLPDGCGVLHGITRDNFTPSNVARAAAEGVALAYGYAVSRLRDLGTEPRQIRVVGEAQSLDLWADACGLEAVAVHASGQAAAGAAMQAAAVSRRLQGEPAELEEMAGHFAVLDESTRQRPDPERHAVYTAQLARQQYLVEILQEGGFL